MAEFDAVLRDAFARAAEPGDPAATSGFGSRWRSLWPYVAGVVVAGILGASLGLSGLLAGDPAAVVTAIPTATASSTPTPTPTPTVTPTPTPPATAEPEPPAPAVDSTKPTLSGASASPATGVCADDGFSAYYPVTSTVSVSASDNVGVAGVHVTWSGPESGSAELGFGSPWSFSFNPAQSTPDGIVTFSLVARDAAGNVSAPVTTTVEVVGSGSCII